MSPKPTFLCLPGAWLPPTIYTSLITELEAHGHTAQTIPLPSAGADPPHKDFTGDVQGIRAAIEQLVDGEGRDVVLVTHSYTGMPGQEAVRGLGREERREKGLRGGVIRLVFVQALALPVGFCLTGGGEEFPEWMRVDEAKGVVTVTPQDAKEMFFHDLSAPEADKWAATLTHQSLGVYSSTVGYAGWRDIPSTYVVGNGDRSSINRGFVDFMIAMARKETPSAFDQVEECDGGHCLMLSYPEWLAGVLERGVEGLGGE